MKKKKKFFIPLPGKLLENVLKYSQRVNTKKEEDLGSREQERSSWERDGLGKTAGSGWNRS